MGRTRHFAGVIGAAGIVVGPLLTTVAAQADDSAPPEWSDYSVEGDGNPGAFGSGGGDDVPNLPVTRPVGKAASLDLMMVDNKPVSLDLPDGMNLPSDGSKLTLEEAAKLQGTLGTYVVDGDLKLVAGSDVTFYDHDSLEGVEWVVDEEGRVVPVPRPAAPKVDAGGSVNTGNTRAASNTVGVAAPVAEQGTDVTDGDDGVVTEPQEVAPPLPETGDENAASVTAASEDATLPLAPLLGITGLALGGGIGVVTLRKKLEMPDSK